MNILIYGNGWIGHQITKILDDKHIGYTIGKSRCDNVKELSNEIILINPTHVLSTVGRTFGNGINTIDCLEDKDMLCTNIRDNLFAPVSLAQICKDQRIHFTYLGTGCIFNKDLETDSYQYTEEDDPDFFGSSYSVVKGFTDRMMRNMFPDVLNVRIRMPLTNDLTCKRNFLAKIISYPNICSIPNSMTYLPELLPIMIDMMILKNTGTINLVNPGLISHNEILEMYNTKIKKHTWTNITIDDQNAILKSKRSNNQLSTLKLESKYKVQNIAKVVENVFN